MPFITLNTMLPESVARVNIAHIGLYVASKDGKVSFIDMPSKSEYIQVSETVEQIDALIIQAQKA